MISLLIIIEMLFFLNWYLFGDIVVKEVIEMFECFYVWYNVIGK